MTTNATKRQTHYSQAQLGRKWYHFGLLTFGVVVLVAILFLWARWAFAAPTPLEPTDLLLLEPQSVVRVEAAARAGDIMAQSTLGIASLDEGRYLPRDVTKAVYWLRKVADRDRSELDRINRRMESLLEKRRGEVDPQERRKLDIEYIDLIATKLAFESAILGLVQVYLGGQGEFHANPELALKYLRLGAQYGFPSMQRTLGIVTYWGWPGIPKDEAHASVLLSEAAAQGDPIAKRLLMNLSFYPARMDTAFTEYSLS